MSLIDAFMEDYILMIEDRTPDLEGGLSSSGWREGAVFKAALVLDMSMSARIAEREGVTNVYTVTTTRNVDLRFQDVIKRVSDGRIFRITSDGHDKKSPTVGTLDIRQCTAERWELTT